MFSSIVSSVQNNLAIEPITGTSLLSTRSSLAKVALWHWVVMIHLQSSCDPKSSINVLRACINVLAKAGLSCGHCLCMLKFLLW